MKGKRIVITRAAAEAQVLGELLARRGAEPLLYPCIARALPLELAPLDAALRAAAAGSFDWLILTSPYTVQMLAQRLATLGLSTAYLRQTAVATVGSATSAAVRNVLGLNVPVVPESYVVESLGQALPSLRRARIFLPQGDLARPISAEKLVAAGADVTTVVAYRTTLGRGGVDLPQLLVDRQVDGVTFTSSSTVNNFLRRLENEGGTLDDLTGVGLACMGPITLRTAQEHGLRVEVLSVCHTLAGLVAALDTYFTR
jgi:uroporphyrinogen III methyltransferase/synthase